MKRIKFIFIVFLFISNSCMNNKDYVLFNPVSVANDKFVVDSQAASTDFYYRLQKVLDFYNEDFKVDNKGNILIPESKWKDQDLMWNYTNKANDPEWLKEHIR